MRITIDLDEIGQLAQKGGKVLLTPEGEEALLKLLDAREAIEQALAEAKDLLRREAVELNPNFSCIRADNLIIYYRPCGPKYRLEESLVSGVPPSLYREQRSYSVVSQAVEKLLETGKRLPAGIIPIERPKKIIISRRDSSDEED